jgi:hypothetical protein
VRRPRLFEPTFFLFVILAFAFMNSAYSCLGRLILAPEGPKLVWTFLGASVGHVVAYWLPSGATTFENIKGNQKTPTSSPEAV